MLIQSVTPVAKNKYEVNIEGKPSMILYKGDLKTYHIAEENEISEERFQELMQNVLLKRAKLRALHLLNDMARTESQLREKLLQGKYPKEIIDGAISYVKSFGYLDDYQYAVNFIKGRQDKKSKREILAALYTKGIANELVSTAMEECYEKLDEKDAIKCILRKKNFHSEQEDEKKNKKMMEYLLRKGFRYDDVRQIIQLSSWNA